MENAVLLNDLDNGVPRGYDRLYFGAEFCQELLPDIKQVKQALRIASEMGIDFSLVTPYVSSEGIARVLRILDVLPDLTEVICNDLGVLWELREFKLTPVVGRLLVRCKRDPRIGKIKKSLPKAANEYLHLSNITQSRVRELFRQYGVCRIETDNTLEPVSHGPVDGFKFSLYHPFVYLTTSRYCPADALISGIFRICNCDRGCKDHVFVADESSSIKAMTIGNAIFYENRHIGPPKGVDRLVFQKGLQDRLDSKICGGSRYDKEGNCK